jgi:UDP-N-acetylglucosamine--dolichyl-phosphate N-acetylglucosaminephosphotransferase
VFFERPASKTATRVLRVLAALKLTNITTHPKSGDVLEATNLTILNFFLLRLGPMSEKRLVQVLINAQVC